MFAECGGPPQALVDPPSRARGCSPSLGLPSLLGLHEEVEVGPGKFLVDAVKQFV